MSKRKSGVEDTPLFAYTEGHYFRVAVDPEDDVYHYIIVNMNGVPVTKNRLPARYTSPDGHIADIHGCIDIPAFVLKKEAEERAKKYCSEVIAGFDIQKHYEKDSSFKSRVKAFFNQTSVQVVLGCIWLTFLFWGTGFSLTFFTGK